MHNLQDTPYTVIYKRAYNWGCGLAAPGLLMSLISASLQFQQAALLLQEPQPLSLAPLLLRRGLSTLPVPCGRRRPLSLVGLRGAACSAPAPAAAAGALPCRSRLPGLPRQQGAQLPPGRPVAS